MKVSEVMTHGVQTINASSSIRDAAMIMKKYDIGAIPVIDRDSLAGMITDRDIAVRAVAEGLEPRDTSVRDVMTKNVFTCLEDSNIEDAAVIMEQKKIRRVVVLNKSKQPVGVVSLGDIVAHGNVKLSEEVLEKVSEPVHSMAH